MSVIKKSLIAIGMGCLVCINTYASESSEEDDNIGDPKVSKHEKIMVRLKELTKIDYGIWAYEKIAPLEKTHWIKQPELFKSAVTVIGKAISACYANSDEFALDENGKPKDLITFAANPKGYDRSNWNAFICWNLINEIDKLSYKLRDINIDKIFGDIKQKALEHYKNDNIENLETKLDESILDISEYNRALKLSEYLETLCGRKIRATKEDYWTMMHDNSARGLKDVTLGKVRKGKICIQGQEKDIKLSYNGYSFDWTLQKAHGLSYPVVGEFLNTDNKFCLELKFDTDKKVWKTSKIRPFKQIKNLEESEKEQVCKILYTDDQIKTNRKQIDSVENYIHSQTKQAHREYKATAKDAVRQLVDQNTEYFNNHHKNGKRIEFYAMFDINAWKDKSEIIQRDLKKILEPIGIELDEDEVFDD
ncbi:MAG: hypothetical protein IJS10_01990 [Alphaproteobacteria bacterium]|nr:hypothetical protein [Alphaproteobacteria bacterium]